MILSPVTFEHVFKLHDLQKTDAIRLSQLRSNPKKMVQYNKELSLLITKLEQGIVENTEYSPLFSWNIDNEKVESTCWFHDVIVTNVLLKPKVQGNLKEMYKLLGQCCEQHKKCYSVLTNKWVCKKPMFKWFQSSWHKSKYMYYKSLMELCKFGTAIEKKDAKLMFLVAQQMEQYGIQSAQDWYDEDHIDLMNQATWCKVCSYALMLWKNEKYGQALFMMNQWLHQKPYTTNQFKLNSWFQTLQTTCTEWQLENNTIYYDPLEFTEIPDIWQSGSVPTQTNPPPSQ